MFAKSMLRMRLQDNLHLRAQPLTAESNHSLAPTAQRLCQRLQSTSVARREFTRVQVRHHFFHSRRESIPRLSWHCAREAMRQTVADVADQRLMGAHVAETTSQPAAVGVLVT